MNCTDIEPLILLQDSGEITDSDRQRLAAHLAGCEACRQGRNELVVLRRLLQESSNTQKGPSKGVLEAIEAAASHQPARLLNHPWRVALGVAAAAAICLVSVRVMSLFLPPSLSMAADESGLDALPLIALTAQPDALKSLTEDAIEIEALADQLLRLQGMDTDEAEDTLMPPEDNPPTTLQSRSIHASQSERYG